MNILTIRLKPGQDLLTEIEHIIRQNNIRAGCILSAVGSLTHAALRLANREQATHFNSPFEIVSATGTVSTNGCHLHLAISDSEGHTVGGHLVPGCTIYTTAEVVLAVFPHLTYRREPCPLSGYEELVVETNAGTPAAGAAHRPATQPPSAG